MLWHGTSEDGDIVRRERKPTLLETRLAKAQKDLLDSQQLAATLYEQNAAKDQAISDLQQLTAAIYEGSVK